MRRSWWLLMLTGVVLVGAVVAADITRNVTRGPKKLCRALESNVRGLDSFGWDNGLTQSSGSWGQVLTDGVSQASDTGRILIAKAVTNDGAGYERFLGALPASSRPAAQRLHDLAVDPSADGQMSAPPHVDADVTELMQLGHNECGFA